MGYAGKLKEKQKARELRKRGLSYKEILKRVRVSKDSISRWCRDVPLTKQQLRRLYLNWKTGQLKGSIIGAKKKQAEREKETVKLLKEGIKDIGGLSKRDFFIAGLMLYCGEGTKGDGRVSFSNSDPALIEFMMKWFRIFCRPPEEKFRGHLYIHENLSEPKAKRYWSHLTRIPLNHFYKTYIAKNNPKRLHKNVHQYGVLKVHFANVKIHRKLMGWIKGVLDKVPK